jgi:hypothetical protein
MSIKYCVSRVNNIATQYFALISLLPSSLSLSLSHSHTHTHTHTLSEEVGENGESGDVEEMARVRQGDVFGARGVQG